MRLYSDFRKELYFQEVDLTWFLENRRCFARRAETATLRYEARPIEGMHWSGNRGRSGTSGAKAVIYARRQHPRDCRAAR
jgi:hypothetical protein